MNPDTLISVHCYAGDAALVERALPTHRAHGCNLLILSPTDSKVKFPGIEFAHAGRAAYIGPESLNRQVLHLRLLLEGPENFFLLNDADSFCVSPAIDARLYGAAAGCIWSNEVTEPRPHESPYPKLAFQPPYFLSRDSIERMLAVVDKVQPHPITPYIDWYMNALSAEAGLAHRPFTELEVPSSGPACATDDPWLQLDYRIRFCNTTFLHPIKTDEQYALCLNAYANRTDSFPRAFDKSNYSGEADRAAG